jgi:hypothetical protein
MTDFAKHQAELRAGQRVYSVNDAPMACDGICICDPRPVEPQPRRSDWRGVFWFCVACAGAVLFVVFKAYAAERVTPGPHDLWLILKPTAIEWAAANEQRNAFKIGADFKDKPTCEAVKKGMREVAGSLQCLPSN